MPITLQQKCKIQITKSLKTFTITTIKQQIITIFHKLRDNTYGTAAGADAIKFDKIRML